MRSIEQIFNVTDIFMLVDVVKLAGVSKNMTMIIHMPSFVDEVIIVLMIWFRNLQFTIPIYRTHSVVHTPGGRRGFFRGGQFSSGGGSGVASPSPRPYVDRSSHGAPDRGRGMPAPSRRHPYSPQGHFDGPHRRGHFDGPHMRGHFVGPHTRGHFNGTHTRSHFDGPHMGGHVDGPHMGGHFDGPHLGGNFDRQHVGDHFDGPHMGGRFDEPSFYGERDRTQGMKRPFHMRVSFSLFLFVVLYSLL